MMSTAPQPRLYLLGTVRIATEQQVVDQFRSHRAVALLVYLVSVDHAVPRSELAELIWPDNPERAAANLRWALSYLKKLLPDSWEVTRQTARFVRGSVDVDIHMLQAALQAGDLAALAAAAPAGEGAFCRGFFIDESPEFETWLLTQRERWRQRLATAWERLVAHHNQPGSYATALTYARRLLALDTWQERSQRQVMLLLARSGDLNAALAQFESCRQLLAAELGVEPQAETRALYERIRRLRDLPRHNLPPQPTPFVGREAEMATLARSLAAPDVRLVSIVAPGGMGKTRLALAAAAAQAGSFLEGVAFVPLAPVNSPERLATTLVETLGAAGFIPAHQGHQSAADFLLEALAPLEMLLLLDNYEQLLPDVALLLAILERAPGITLLVTSRERLNVRWEQPLALRGLPFAGVPAAGGSTGRWPSPSALSSAARLFLQAAQRVRPGLETTVADRDAVDTICRLVEGMPLALELAATWVRLQPPTAIAAELAGNLALLQTSARDVPQRQRSMHAIFDQTWARLSKVEQETVARLSVFRGPFPAAAAAAVTDADWQRLATLVDRSLLRRRRRTAAAPAAGDDLVTYELHELLRQYAAEQLDALGQTDPTRRRHARYFAELLTTYEPRLYAGETQAATLALMRRQIENIRTAWHWALETGDGPTLNQMLSSYYLYYQLPEQPRDGLAAMAAAAARLTGRQENEPALRLAYGRLLAHQARFAWSLHEDYAGAEALARRSLAILEKEGDNLALARILHTLGNMTYQKDLAAAQRYWKRSLAFYEQEGNLERQARLTRNLCVTAPTYDEMHHYGALSTRLVQANNDLRNEGHICFIRGDREYRAGHRELGRRLARRSVALLRRVDDPPHLLLALNVLAQLHLEEDAAADARPLIAEMTALADQIAIPWYSLLVTLIQAQLALAEKRLNEAERLLDEALAATAAENEYRQQQTHVHYFLGRLHMLRGNREAARAAWAACRAAAQPLDYLHRVRSCQALAEHAATWLQQGNHPAAAALLQQGRALAEATGIQVAWEAMIRRLAHTYGVDMSSL